MENRIKGKGFSYEKLSLINSGSYGEIFKAKQLPSGERVVLKRINKSGTNLQRIEGEIQAGRKLNGIEGIPHFHHYFESCNSYWLVFDYIRGNNLYQKLEKRGKEFSERFVRKVLSESVNILLQAHSKGVAHKDIKMENIMWNESKNKTNVLDFGLCFQFKEKDICNDYAGSAEYYAPELLFGVPNFSATQCDVWALGVVIFTLAFGVFPFAYDEEEDRKIRETGMHPLPHFPERTRVSNQLIQILKGMLEIDPTKRITMNQLSESIKKYKK